MRKGFDDKVSANGGGVKVIEKTGSSVTAGLRQSDPFKAPGCPYRAKCYAAEGQDCTKQEL